MRHFGVFATFVTNQPDAIKQEIYRQADNIFLYNFSNDNDLNLVSQASMVDTDTVKSIVRTLPPRMCLVLGHAVNNLPVVVTVDEFDSPAERDHSEVLRRDHGAHAHEVSPVQEIARAHPPGWRLRMSEEERARPTLLGEATLTESVVGVSPLDGRDGKKRVDIRLFWARGMWPGRKSAAPTG